MKEPAWLSLARKIRAAMEWNPFSKNPIIPNIFPRNVPEGKISEARGDKPRQKLKLGKETLRTLAIQTKANRNLENMQGQQNPLRNERQGLILADSIASCVEFSLCPQCPHQVEVANREKTVDFCPGVPAQTQNYICSEAEVCRNDYYSGDPYGDLCVTGRAGGTGGDLGGC